MENDTKYWSPLFKFLANDRMQSFLDGQAWLPNMVTFRNEPGPDLIDELEEGKSSVQFINQEERTKTEVLFDPSLNNDCLIFCAARSILSESLKWAVKANRSRCCLIFSPERFVDDINNNLPAEIRYFMRRECIYRPRDIAVIGESTEDTNKHFLYDTLFVKPRNYSGQMEHRICWVAQKGSIPKGYAVNTLKASPIVEVEFEVAENLKSGIELLVPNIRHVKIKVITKIGDDAFLSAPYELDLFNPIAFSDSGKEYLGFLSASNCISYMTISGGNYGARVPSQEELPNNAIICLSVLIDNIQKIQYKVT